MKSKAATAFSGAGFSLILLASLVGGSTSAVASTDDGTAVSADESDRTVYLNEPAPALSDLGQVTASYSEGNEDVWVTEGTNFPVTPRDGETVRVIYTDAVADVDRAGGCTQSLTTFTPTLSIGQVYVSSRWMVSTGCSSNAGVSVGLYSGLSKLAGATHTAENNGRTVSTRVYATCNKTTRTQFYGISAWTSGGKTQGPFKDLNCRV